MILIPQNIKTPAAHKLRIYPPLTDRNNVQFELHSVRAVLPNVIVKVRGQEPPGAAIFGRFHEFLVAHCFLMQGIPTVQRAIINKENKVDRYKLLVEGSVRLSSWQMEIKHVLGIVIVQITGLIFSLL